ncbi:MAG: glycosyltransferase family 4 protein [Chloroflexota bacterium]
MSTDSITVDQADQHIEAHRALGFDVTDLDVVASRRIWIVSDDLSGPPDEGVKKFTLSIAAALQSHHEVELISTHGSNDTDGVRSIPTSRSFLSLSLRAALRSGQPEVIIYATHRSATFFSFIRARLLKFYCPGVPVVLLGLQTRRHSRWQQLLIRQLRPDLTLVQSDLNREYLAGLGCNVAVVPSGVDVNTFRPVSPGRRLALRKQYGLDITRPIILHIGHLKEGRGIRDLIPLAASDTCQVVLVTSTSTPQEARLADDLRAAGVRLITEYLPNIEELYQLSDCYVFPVRTTDNAIEIPLSVLEALACDLPVVTTRFGGLQRLFGHVTHPGIVFVDSTGELTAEALRIAQIGRRGTRVFALPFSWEQVARILLSRQLPQ